MAAPSWPSVVRVAVPLVVKLLSSERCHSPLSTEGIGSQARVAPCARLGSTRVVSSKVRQSPGCGAKRRSWAKAPSGRVREPAAAAADFRRVRRLGMTASMPSPPQPFNQLACFATRPVVLALDAPARLALRVESHGGGEHLDVPGLRSFAHRVQQHRHQPGGSLDMALHRRGAFLEVHRLQDELVAVEIGHLLQGRHLGAARLAPAGPEVDDGRLPDGGHGDLVAVEVLGLPGRVGGGLGLDLGRANRQCEPQSSREDDPPLQPLTPALSPEGRGSKRGSNARSLSRLRERAGVRATPHAHARSATHCCTDCKALASLLASVPPAIARSGLPPPLPPTCWATKLTSSPALTLPMRSAVTPAAICTVAPSTVASTMAADFSLSFSLSMVSRSVLASAPSSRAASTLMPLTSTACEISSSPCEAASLPFSCATSFSSARTCSSTCATRPFNSFGDDFSEPATACTVPSSSCR